MERMTNDLEEVRLGMAPGRCNNRDILTTKLGRVIAIEVLDRNDEPSFSRICDLLNNWERSTFETELTAALSRFFDSVRDATLATCVREGIRVTSVGITLPEQWPRAAAELFISVSRTTFLRTDTHFNVSRDDIHWSNETQALCHYILKDRAEMLQKYGSSGFPVVLADYARPNPNMSVSWVQSGSNNTMMVFDMEESPGPIGGSGRQDRFAMGAAYATGNDQTVKEFIDHGAAIGVQVKEARYRVWNNEALLLCHTDNGYRRVLDVEEGDELKLICKPCQILNLEHEYMDLSRAYDILVLGVFNRGKAKFWATFVADEEGSEPKLFLRISWLPALGLPGIEYKWFSTSVTLPLTFDRPSGCMFVVQNGVGPTLPPQALVNPPSL